MVDTSDDAGTIQVLLDRLNKQRLPRMLALQEKVNNGECLTEFDLQFLDTLDEAASDVVSLAEKHPELQSLVAHLVALYSEITRKGLENEQKS